METYYTHLSFIPDAAIVNIVNDIIKETKPNPSQFPTINDFFKGWYKWQADNPHMMKKRERRNCAECYGRGWLWFRVPPDEKNKYPHAYEFIVACSVCDNHKIDVGLKRKVPKSTRKQLEARGYAAWPYEYTAMKRGEYKSLKEMTDDIGGDV